MKSWQTLKKTQNMETKKETTKQSDVETCKFGEKEIVNKLAAQMLAEINREIISAVTKKAKKDEN